ncbi:winged helix DNA-binding domain-containing protein [Microbacter sp. GSS18]|nr:winged helix DNA-binding domain-containing protein [Microbacter sp. GSS18]
MASRSVPDARLRSHRLTAPAQSVADAARHMLAVQSQEFRGGRWALGVRTRGAPTVRDVDAAFDRGEIVRSWTMRGTIHIVPARDLGWMLPITGERQFRGLASAHRREGLAGDDFARAEKITRAALRGGGRLTRDELFAVLDGGRVGTAGQRGYHLLVALSLRGVVCQGPVARRDDGTAREQHIVLAEEWVRDAVTPADPHAELFARYIVGHGPAGVGDFAWWSGLPLGTARRAAEAAATRLTVTGDGDDARYTAAPPRPRRSPRPPGVIALPPFDEYYLSYADRSAVCAPELLDRVGPSKNGMVAAVLIASGQVVGRWTHAVAVRREVPELFRPEAAHADDVTAALERYRTFTGA